MRTSILFISITAALSLALSACTVTGESPEDDDLGAAAQPQIDPGQRDYVVYTVSQNSLPIGKILIAKTTGGGYAAGLEYWYMTANVAMTSALSISGATAQFWSTAPSGLGTLSFVMQQEPAWTTTTPRGNLLRTTNALTGEEVMLSWQMTEAGGAWSGYIVWYHSNTGNVFGPGSSNTLSPSTSYSGSYYHYVANAL